jgi:hypothetical protein
MNHQRLAFLSALTLLGAAGYGCGGEVLSGSTGTGGSSVTSSQGGAVSDVAVSASSGFGGDGSGQSGVSAVSSGAGVGGSLPGCQPKDGVVLAVTKMYFGDTDFNDAPNKVNGWKQYGANIDGKVSTASSVDLCKPVNNTPAKIVYPDGDNGNDNSFGKNILPILMGISSDVSTAANKPIIDGQYTLIFHLVGLGAMADQASLASKVYTGTPLMGPPKLDGSDCWPVAPEGLANPADIASAKAFFPTGSLTMNHWDSGPTSATVTVEMSIQGFTLHFDIVHARLSMDLDADHLGSQLGQISGVVNAAALVAELKKVAGAFDPSLCSGPTIDSIAQQFMQAADILADGTQDPAKTCDGISIGLGFKARTISIGGVGPATPAQPDPCAP